MTIKYAGPRPEISQHGIQFKDGKEDKYVYLMISVQMIKALDHEYEGDHSYSYDINTKRLTNDEMKDIIKRYEPEIEKNIETEMVEYAKHLDEEVEHIENRNNLKEVEKETWVNNLKLMKPYKIQRAVNKIYYMHSIDIIKKIILKEKIKQIDTPFYEKFWHVLQTLQGHMEEGRIGMICELNAYTNDKDELMASLIVPGFK